MLDRITPPVFQKLGSYDIKEAEHLELDNGRKVFHLAHGDQSIFKIELFIRAGSSYAEKYEWVQLTLKMLNEGTKSLSSNEFADAIDSLGAFIDFTPGFDYSSINVFSLTKHFNEVIRLLSDVIYEPRLNEDDFLRLKKKEHQQLKLNEEKTGYLSSVAFRKSLFGPEHPYGKSSDTTKLQEVELAELDNFFRTNFHDFDVLISGKTPPQFYQVLNDHFGKQPILKSKKCSVDTQITPTNSFVQKDNSVQSSIKIGKRLFNRNHPDYIKLLVTNELLGGFFGSRLMKNIREEKGLTYGIHSHIYALNQDGYFSISTDVNGESTNLAVDEIFKEITLLENEEVPEAELEIVKSYMLGTFSSALATPFSLMDRFKAIHYQGLDYEYYSEYFNTLSNITPSDLLAQSSKHLSSDTLIMCIAGSR